jgi:hypothetical protein
MAPAQFLLQRIPVVGGLAYRERVQLLPSSFTVALAPEKDNKYFRHAIAVLVNGGKIGYVAPEIASRYYESLLGREGQPLTCPGRRAAPIDREETGVETLLDFSSLDVTASP